MTINLSLQSFLLPSTHYCCSHFFLSSDTAKSNGCYKWIPSTELMPPNVPVDSLRFSDLLKWNAFQALEYQQVRLAVCESAKFTQVFMPQAFLIMNSWMLH